MATKFDSGRTNLDSRKRMRALFAIAIITVVGFVALSGHALDRRQLPLSDSQKALQQVREISEGSNAEPVAAKAPPVKTARLLTCPACRLNSLPLVKKFVYELAPHFKPTLSVEFKVGNDPVLYLYEGGKEVEKKSLVDMNWEQIIHKLVKFGIPPVTENALISDAIKKMEK